MRPLILFSITLLLGAGALLACNSNESGGHPSSVISQPPQQPQQQPQQPGQNPPAKEARRITAEELHDLWEKGNVLVVDTRDEASYKSNHIKGAISIPSNQVVARLSEFPRDKMIVTYCT